MHDLRVQPGSGLAEGGAVGASLPFGNQRPRARRMQHQLDPAGRSILLEARDGSHRARDPSGELPDRALGSPAHVLRYHRVMRVKDDLHVPS